MESSDEEGEQDQPKKKRGTKKSPSQDSPAGSRGQAWIKEGGEDEPLNFLDPSVTQRVSGEYTTNLEAILHCYFSTLYYFIHALGVVSLLLLYSN